ncbi:MAG: acyltransferase [Idiomarina sp.]|nr:acyltransferase [Idiomarina sp.]
MKYRREIDGLRAVAVLPVILFHAGFSWFSGGYVGVDVFFVISGYLITTIIINELDKGEFSIGKFYERRARRILPALFFVMFICIPFAWAWMVPSQFKDFAHGLIAISFFVSNVLFWRKEDYFAPAAEENPLLHTWSLAVEEQFYIFFPVLLLVLWRFGRNPVFYVVLLMTAVSLALAEWGWRNYPSANFYLLPTRAWELGVGAICAFLMSRKEFVANNLLALLGLSLIVFSIIAFDQATPFPSLYAVLPVAGTALIVMYGSKDSFVGRLLAIKPLVWIGLISYSAYLWHQPVLAFSRIRAGVEPSQNAMVLLVLLSLVLAYISWKYIEQPFRNKTVLSFTLTRSRIFGATAAVSVAFVSLGVYGHMSNGMFDSWKNRHPEQAMTYELITREIELKMAGPQLGQCQFRTITFDESTMTRVAACAEQHGQATMVVGDSHSIDVFNGIVLNGHHPFIIGAVSAGCRPHTPETGCQYANVREFVSIHSELVSQVYYTQAGFHLLSGSSGGKEITGRPIFTHVHSHSKINATVKEDFVELVAEYLDELSRYTRTTWIGPRIEPHISNREIINSGCSSVFSLRDGQAATFESLGNSIEKSSSGKGFVYLDQIKRTNLNMQKDFIDCDQWFWSDGDHWSLSGAKEFVSRLL